jgi:arginine N-succinyltransferase
LLSLARFVFMSAFPRRFDREVIAELRGWQDEAGLSPFWESVGRHFFERDYSTADFLSGLGNKAFIEDLMPKYPIYLSLLPPEVQAVIGRVHRDTEPALKLLLEEGFVRSREVDIFDAGPLLRAELKTLRTVRQCRSAPVARLVDPPPGAPQADAIVCKSALQFRACLGTVSVDQENIVSISDGLARALEVEAGDTITWTPARANGPSSA